MFTIFGGGPKKSGGNPAKQAHDNIAQNSSLFKEERNIRYARKVWQLIHNVSKYRANPSIV